MKNLNEDLTKSKDKVIKESITECEGMHTYVQPIKEYIDELEKTLTRAKKEHDLLGLYREVITNISGVFNGSIRPKDIDERMIDLFHQIEQLESEMK
jgi:hypothetical protein